nr:hypothetical protein [Tanacetum cinerariifolium]
RARFTTPTGEYEVGESSVAAAARQIMPALTIDDSRRAEDRLIGRLRRESTLQGQQIDDKDRLTRHIQHEYTQRDVAPEDGRFNLRRTSLTGFPAQSISSSNTIALDSPHLLVLNTGASQSRQHVDTSLIHIESCKPPTAELFDVDYGRIAIRHCEY